ncbi:MAG TPA: hypothetical protein VMI75_27815 [Polyangiaceae bacterium]|nr:hypothetical protein [Polyangiaceae bacterium]
MPSMRIRNRWQLALVAGITGVVLSAACGNSNPPVLNDSNPDASSGTGSCDKPGCPCTAQGQKVSCDEQISKDPDGVTCAEGTTVCNGTTWGPCEFNSTMFKSLHGLSLGGDGTLHPLDLQGDAGADAGNCATDPCDPSCQGFVDTSTGVDAGSGLVPTVDGGWTLPLEGADGGGCQGLQCQVPICGSGLATAITGTVWDPAAINPVYNALVMIPNGTVQPIAAGVSSDPCGGATLPAAVSYAYSDTKGHFTLSNVPVGTSIPLVIQLGRWRRVTTIDTSALTCVNPSTGATNISSAAGCGDPSPGLNKYSATAGCPTRFPRTQSDGNIPEIAIATGGLDAIECMLYRIGISSSEYTDENGTGRINIFNNGGANLGGSAANHDLSYLLGFTCPGSQCPTPANTTNITNASFEGNLNGWTASGTASDSSTQAQVGNDSALVGSSSSTNTGTNTLSQTFTAPAGATGLSFWVYSHCSTSSTIDYAGATLTDNTSSTTVTWWGTHATGCPSSAAWVNLTANGVTAGHSYTLTFKTYDGDSHHSYAWFDDVSWLPTPTVPSLVDNYDLIMLPCDGGNEYNSANWGSGYDDPGRQTLVNYAAAGGRIFTSHWGREWIERATAASGLLPNGPFPNVATWITDTSPSFTSSATGDINSGSSWGANFNTWMTNVGAATNAKFTIDPWREDTSAVSANSRLFVSYDGNHGTTQGYPADFTFDTPVGSASPVGRVMFTDMHLANGTPSGTFPNNCPTQGSALLAQEDAAEYLLFDLSSCVTGLPLPTPSQQYNPSTFTRDYQAVCPSGYRPRWRYFQWSDQLPSDSNITFTAYTADTEAQLGTQYTPPLPLTLWTSTAANPGPTNPASPPPPYPAYGVDVDPALVASGVPTWNASGPPPAPSGSYAWLRVNMTLNPSSDKMSAPTLIAWQQTYDCVSSE